MIHVTHSVSVRLRDYVLAGSRACFAWIERGGNKRASSTSKVDISDSVCFSLTCVRLSTRFLHFTRAHGTIHTHTQTHWDNHFVPGDLIKFVSYVCTMQHRAHVKKSVTMQDIDTETNRTKFVYPLWYIYIYISFITSHVITPLCACNNTSISKKRN